MALIRTETYSIYQIVFNESFSLILGVEKCMEQNNGSTNYQGIKRLSVL